MPTIESKPKAEIARSQPGSFIATDTNRESLVGNVKALAIGRDTRLHVVFRHPEIGE